MPITSERQSMIADQYCVHCGQRVNIKGILLSVGHSTNRWEILWPGGKNEHNKPERLFQQGELPGQAGTGEGNECDHETAVNYLKEVVEREPQHAAAFTMLGDCHDCLGQYEQAIAYYSQALGIDPDHADAWFNKGMTLKVLGRTEEAVQCIEKSIELYCGR